MNSGSRFSPLRLTVLLLVLIGLGLCLYSRTMPVLSNGRALEWLWAKGETMTKPAYYELETSLRTNKNMYMDLGTGMSIAFSLVLVFLFVTRTRTISDLRLVRTMKIPALLFSMGLVLLLLIPGTHWYYVYRGMRGDYPPFADSIGIPVMEEMMIFPWVWSILMGIILLSSIGAKLPAYLFSRPARYDLAAVLWEIWFGILICADGYLLVLSVMDGDHVPILVQSYLLYVLACLRAGQVGMRPVEVEHSDSEPACR